MEELTEKDSVYLCDLIVSRQEELRGLRNQLTEPLLSCKVGIEEELACCEAILLKLT